MSAEFRIRRAVQSDLEPLLDLLIRNKRLNEEFDPMLSTSSEIRSAAHKYLSEALSDPKSLVLVAEDHRGKMLAFLKADLIERVFYSPEGEGVIREFYVLPEYRRKGLGKLMIDAAVKELVEMGAGIITAEFPSQHKIAVTFYESIGFRPLFSKYAKELTK
ncbi:MAG: GNAT family N-acetyltransferase [Thaumarchaeota archaeon]|nr:GNAT family N-acetyltransferase [Candidatus Calditenuaceae archaeon]MDW8187206.1 GNAT family N-acetyltransferase [Nitrososphaerota archaeon]